MSKVVQLPVRAPIGVVHWSKRQRVGDKHSAWYDHSFFEVPFDGDYDAGRVKSALVKRLSNNFISRFGGQTHVGDVTLLRPGVLLVETLYSIGE